MATSWQDATAQDFQRMTRVDNLKPGQRIQYGLSRLTISAIGSHGDNEVTLVFAEGGSIILSKANWFQVI